MEALMKGPTDTPGRPPKFFFQYFMLEKTHAVVEATATWSDMHHIADAKQCKQVVVLKLSNRRQKQKKFVKLQRN